MNSINITDALTLPRGAVIKNRMGKSAMSENTGPRGFYRTLLLKPFTVDGQRAAQAY